MYFKPPLKIRYKEIPSNLQDNFMPYIEVNLLFFEQSTNVVLFILYLIHSSLKSHAMKVKKVSQF